MQHLPPSPDRHQASAATTTVEQQPGSRQRTWPADGEQHARDSGEEAGGGSSIPRRLLVAAADEANAAGLGGCRWAGRQAGEAGWRDRHEWCGQAVQDGRPGRCQPLQVCCWMLASRQTPCKAPPPEAIAVTGIPMTPYMCRTPSLARARAIRKYPSLGCWLKSMAPLLPPLLAGLLPLSPPARQGPGQMGGLSVPVGE